MTQPLEKSTVCGCQRELAWIILGLFTLTFAVYWPVLGHGFVNYDDPTYVVQNPHVTGGLTWSGMIWAFSSFHAGNWHPLTWLSHMLDCQLFGLNAGGHHLTSILLHAFTAIFLFLALRRMTGSMWRSALVAALFAWHPLRVESVAWVSERKDVLSGCFGMLTLWLHARRAKVPAWRDHALVLGSYALSLLAKGTLVTLPFLLLVLDVWPGRRLSLGRTFMKELPGLIRAKAGFFLLAVGVSIATFVAQSVGEAVVRRADLPVGARLANAVVSYVRYLSDIFWPLDLAVFYPYRGWAWWEVLSALGLLLGVSAICIRWRTRSPWLLTGWCWFLGTLVPMIGLVQVGIQSMADRYTYIPAIGITLLVVWQLADWMVQRPVGRRPIIVMAGLLAGALMLRTHDQLQPWRSSLALFTHAAAVTKNNDLAHLNMGHELDKLGRTAEAREQFIRALEIRPEDKEANYNLGVILAREGANEKAAFYFERAVANGMRGAEAFSRLGEIRFAEGRAGEAIRYFQQALEVDPQYFEAHHNLGTVYSRLEEAANAIHHFESALKINPHAVATRVGLAMVLARTGELDGAEGHLREAVRLEPADFQAVRLLAGVLASGGKMEEASDWFRKAIEIKPDDRMTRFQLSGTLWSLQRYDQSVAELKWLVEHAPDWPPARSRLAWILATHQDATYRNGAEAVRLAEAVEQLIGRKTMETQDIMGAAYAEAGRFPEAVKAAGQALELARAAGQSGLAAQFRSRLESYRQNQPWRDPSSR